MAGEALTRASKCQDRRYPQVVNPLGLTSSLDLTTFDFDPALFCIISHGTGSLIKDSHLSTLSPLHVLCLHQSLFPDLFG